MNRIILTLLFAWITHAIATESIAQNIIPRSVFGCGGTVSSDGSYSLKATLGQSLIGKNSSASNQALVGFWYTIGAIKVDVGKLPASPVTFFLTNYPNPFSKRTMIRFVLPSRARVELTAFDVLGRKLMTITNEEFEAGSHEVVFDASAIESRNAAQLIYCTLQARHIAQSLPMIVLE